MKKLQTWIEIALKVPPELGEACASIIFEEAGQGSFIEEGPVEDREWSCLKAYLLKDASFRKNLITIKKRVENLLTFFPALPSPVWELRLIFEENWQENWKRSFKPLRVGSKIVVCPTWEDYGSKGDEVVLRMDPGQAFGTGEHVSTRLCLKAMESLSQNPIEKDVLFSRVLDVGTGSGILALVAAFFQAGSILAIDHDPLAVEAARSHVILNGLEAKIRVEMTRPEKVNGPFSLILANLSFHELLPLGQTFKDLLSQGGCLIVSGLLISQARVLISEFIRKKMGVQILWLEDEWACVIFQKN